MATKREDLIQKLRERYGENIHCRTTEEFDGGEGGIWMSAENKDPKEKDGLPVFDYYGELKVYREWNHGVHIKFEKFLQKHGWYTEWYDCGTIMLYEA